MNLSRNNNGNYIIYRVLTFESSFLINQPIFGSSQYDENQAKIVKEVPSPKQDNTNVVNSKSRYTLQYSVLLSILKFSFWSLVAKLPQHQPNPPDEVDTSQKFESGGASIVYVHTFCSELFGDSSGLDLCRWGSRL